MRILIPIAILCIIIFASSFYLYKRTIVQFIDNPLYQKLALLMLFCCGASMFLGVLLTRNAGTSVVFYAKIISVIAASYLFFLVLIIIRDVALVSLNLLNLESIYKALASKNTLFFFALSSFSSALYGVYEGTRVPDVKNVSIAVKDLPDDLQGFTIAQITDLHSGTGSNGKWLKKVVEITNNLNADIIVCTGDIVDNVPEVLGEDMKELAKLHAKHGVYLILGNHEYILDVEKWVDYFIDLEMPLLINDTRLIEVGNAHVAVTGLGDLSVQNRQNFIEKGLAVDYEKANNAISPEIFNADSTFNLLLMHQPKGAAEHAKYGYDLQLAGHTHGGQVFVLFPLIEAANDGFRLGLYEVGNMLLYVSSGTSQWGFWSVRIGAPAEITYITLVKA